MKINLIKEGSKFSGKYLVTTKTKGIANSGKYYLTLRLQDNSGNVEAKKWDCDLELCNLIEVGFIIDINAEALKHKNNYLQLKINSIKIVDINTIDIYEFIEVAPIPKAEMIEKLNYYIDSIKDSDLKLIVTSILKDSDDFYTIPAAIKFHHNVGGGLLYHVVVMLDLANAIVNIYQNIDKDLLYAGVILHDMGKVEELNGPITIKYTTEGKLLGHISIINAKINEYAKTLNIKSEKITLLQHLILSHHGKLEYGSPKLPMVKEAEILTIIDNFDARINAIDNALANIKEGEFTPRIAALEDRSFYKPNKNNS